MTAKNTTKAPAKSKPETEVKEEAKVEDKATDQVDTTSETKSEDKPETEVKEPVLKGKLLYPARIGKKTEPAGKEVELTQEQFDELVALGALAPAKEQ